ncbi:hypothetical protein V2A60_003784 [Cordyceps javanica]
MKKKASGAAIKIASVGQLIEGLEKYPPTVLLDDVDREFLKAIMSRVRHILEASWSTRNLRGALTINALSIHEDVKRQFNSWINEPSTFWHPESYGVEKYSERISASEKAQAFYLEVLGLRGEVEKHKVRWRLSTISAYLDYDRVSSERITTLQVKQYLEKLQCSANEQDVQKCKEILSGGRRRFEFCQRTGATTDGRKGCYGPMFLEGIPDEIWEKRNGMVKLDAEALQTHLGKLKIQSWSESSRCNEVTEKLLQFNENLFSDSTRPTRADRAPGQNKRKRQRHTGPFHASHEAIDNQSPQDAATTNPQQGLAFTSSESVVSSTEHMGTTATADRGRNPTIPAVALTEHESAAVPWISPQNTEHRLLSTPQRQYDPVRDADDTDAAITSRNHTGLNNYSNNSLTLANSFVDHFTPPEYDPSAPTGEQGNCLDASSVLNQQVGGRQMVGVEDRIPTAVPSANGSGTTPAEALTAINLNNTMPDDWHCWLLPDGESGNDGLLATSEDLTLAAPPCANDGGTTTTPMEAFADIDLNILDLDSRHWVFPDGELGG